MVPKGLHSKPKRLGVKWLAAAVSLAMVAVACSGDDTSTDPEPDSTTTTSVSAPDPTTTTTTEPPDQATATTTTTTTVPAITEDRAYYILPPGNYGGIPTTDNSFDQLPLYDGLTPLRGDISDADIDSLFLPQNFEPVGETVEEPTGREGTTILYDEFGIAHVSGVTREDLAFGAGWVTARDRDLLLTLGRGPARVAVADVPGINAFRLITSAQSFTPSAAAEQLVTDQVNLIVETYGSEGEQIISDAAAYAEGINAFWEANGIVREPANVNDVIAVTAFIGSIFGAGGGSEVANAEFLSGLKNALGAQQGTAAWEDFMQTDDPEAPTTIDQRFEYGTFTGGGVTGSVVIDEGSVISLDPRAPVEGSASVLQRREGLVRGSLGASVAYRIELVDGGPGAVRQQHDARGDGSPTRLLLPRDRPADSFERPGNRSAGNRGARVGDVHPYRTYHRLCVEPHIGQPGRDRRVRRGALQPRWLHP